MGGQPEGGRSDRPTVRPSDASLEFPPMPEITDALPPSRIVRWLAIAVLIGFAVTLYFREGTRLAPVTGAAPGAAADSGN